MVTTKLKFTATPGFPSYDDRPRWQDGDIRNIEIDIAKRLVADFPANFSYVKEEKAIQYARNKAIRGRKNK